MNGPAFFDTDILIYADDASVPHKQSARFSSSPITIAVGYQSSLFR